MKNKYKLLTVLIICSMILNISVVFAEVENKITLEEAKILALKNSRDIRNSVLDTEKSKLKVEQAEDEYKDYVNSYNSLLAYYYYLNDRLAEGDTSVEEKITELEIEISEAKGKITSEKKADLLDSKRDAEDNYDDIQVAQDNYEKKFEHSVTELYTKILDLEGSLEAQQKDYEYKLLLVNIERKRMQLGRSTQDKIDELAIQASNVNNNIINTNNSLKTFKGQLNDMLGREYDAPLELEKFEVVSTAVVPAYQPFIDKVFAEYTEISQLERDIMQKEEDLDDANYEDNDYQKELLGIEIDEMELQLEDEKINLIEKTNEIVTDYKEKQKAYQLAELEFKTAENDYLRDKKRFELGSVSKLELLSSELNFQKAYNNKFSTGYAFFLAQSIVQLAEQGIII